MMPAMASYDTDAGLLRSICYSEADAVLVLDTRERGGPGHREGVRRTNAVGGRLQPGVLRRTCRWYLGRGDLGTVRAASVIDADAGLWVAVIACRGRLRARDRDARDAGGGAERGGLAPAAGATPSTCCARARPGRPARLDPFAPGRQAELLVVSGLLPLLVVAPAAVRRAPSGLLGVVRGARSTRAAGATRSRRGRSPLWPLSSAAPWPRRPTPCRPRPRRASSA